MKIEHPKFGSIFNLNMLSTILYGATMTINHKMTAMAFLLKIKTCSENQTPLSFGVYHLNILLAVWHSTDYIR